MSVRLSAPRRDLFPVLKHEYLTFLNPTETIGRVYWSAGQHPMKWDTFRTYGPLDRRFDHHPLPLGEHPRRGIVYGVSRREDPNFEILLVCLLECFQRTHAVNRWRGRPYFTMYRPTRPLCLLNLTSRWAPRTRCNGAISSGDHAMARRWSRAIYLYYTGANAKYVDADGRERPLLLDGLLYQCSLWPGREAVALYERAMDAIPAVADLDAPLSDSRFDELMEELGEVGLGMVMPGVNALPLSPARAA